MANEPMPEGGWTDDEIRAKLEGLSPEEQQQLAEQYAAAEGDPEKEAQALANVTKIPAAQLMRGELTEGAEDALDPAYGGDPDLTDQVLLGQIDFLQTIIQEAIFQLAQVQAALMLRGRR